MTSIFDKILAITKSTDSRQLKQAVAMERTTDSFSWRGKQEEVKEYEKKIDQMVYKLYGLTKEEIKIIEESFENNKMGG